MHTIQYILTSATSVSEACENASNAANDSGWSDWHAVGGRWNDAIAQRFPAITPTLSDGNVLPVWEYPNEARDLIADICRRQNESFLETRDALAGNMVAVSDIPGHIFGLPVSDSVDTARRISESNLKHAADWQNILSASTLDEAQSTFSMATYYARRLAQIVDGEWNSESAFYDAIGWSCHTRHLSEAISDPAHPYRAGGQSLYLVVIDFHF